MTDAGRRKRKETMDREQDHQWQLKRRYAFETADGTVRDGDDIMGWVVSEPDSKPLYAVVRYVVDGDRVAWIESSHHFKRSYFEAREWIRETITCLRTNTERANYSVYKLLDPRDHQVRWIGITTNPKQRLQGHIGSYHDKQENPEKVQWILELKRSRLVPIMGVVLSGRTHRQALQEEAILIQEHLRQGVPLLNRDRRDGKRLAKRAGKDRLRDAAFPPLTARSGGDR